MTIRIVPAKPRPRFRLVLEAHRDPLGGDTPAAIRLKLLLKWMLRQWGFECVDYAEVKDDES